MYNLIKDTPKFENIATLTNGSKINYDAQNRVCKSLKRQLNIEMGCKVYRNKLAPPLPLAEDVVPYCLRHTYCTTLAKKGIDIRTAQKLMGHSDITLTANIYTHVDTEDIIKAADLLTKNNG